jgi:hypothetical protein
MIEIIYWILFVNFEVNILNNLSHWVRNPIISMKLYLYYVINIFNNFNINPARVI